MTIGSNPSHPQFPDGDRLARAFFEEGIRHLEDARILHEAGRYPASIASAMKAAEFGIKTVIILSGAMGWWDKIFITHSPLSDIDNNIALQHHVVTLAGYNRALIAGVKGMEKLSPGRPSGAYRIDEQENPEYPFLSYHPGPATSSGEFRLDKPSTHFKEADSKGYYNTAQDLLTAVATQYATVGGWALAIPNAF